MSTDTPVKEKCSSKLPTTVKRRTVSADMSRGELLQLLSVMEGELQAREVSIAVLKAEKAQHYIQQAAFYGSPTLTADGPYDALRRDKEMAGDTATDTPTVIDAKQILDGLVDTQRKSQLRTRIQLAAIEKQFHKVCAELEAEKRQHSAVLTETHGVQSALEMDKQTLQSQLDVLKDENSRLLVESQELKNQLAAEKAESLRHSQAAAILARERTWLGSKLMAMDHLVSELEANLNDEQKRTKTLASELLQMSSERKSVEDKLTADLQSERERSRLALDEKESRLSSLSAEVEQIRLQLLQLQHSEINDDSHRQINSPSVDYLSLESMVRTSVADIDRLPAGNTTVPDLRPVPIATSCNVTLPCPASGLYQNVSSSAVSGRNELNVSFTLKAPLVAARNVSENESVLLTAGESAIQRGLVQNNERSQNVGFQRLPSATRRQGHLDVTNATDFIGVRQAKSADLSNTSLSLVDTPNSSAIGGSCPSELSSGSSSSVAKKLDFGTAPGNSLSVQPNLPPITSVQCPPSPASSMALEIFGPEMADLQELLVSMATDKIPPAAISSLTPSFPSSDLSPPIQSLSPSSALHAAVLAGNSVSLGNLLANHRIDVNEPIGGGISLLHCAVECGSEECVRLLLENGAVANITRDDGRTPVHLAASDGQIRCLQQLLEFDGSPVSTDHHGWTPLHCAASAGQSDCCRKLLDHGARIDSVTYNNWTPLHVCIQAGQSACLAILLTHRHSPPSSWSDISTPAVDQTADAALIEEVLNIADRDGWTVGHLATVRDSKDCLEVLMQYVHLDVERRDKWNRNVLDVASPACRQFLLGLDGRQDIVCTVSIDMQVGCTLESQSSPRRVASGDSQLSVLLGSVTVSKGAGWSELEEKLSTVFLNHASEVSVGLRTKKTCRFDQDWPDPPTPFTLGISLNSVKYFSIGRYHWSPGTSTDKMPYDMLCGFNTSSISVKLFGLDNVSQDSLAYETLIPVSILQNYLRLIEQYKSVVFYGPKGMGKTYLVKKLAQCIQTREAQAGNTSEVTFFTLSTVFSRKDLLKLLLDKGCLIPSSTVSSNNSAPVLVLDDLSKISVVDVFKDILPAMETRGPANSIVIRRDGSQEAISCFMHPNCYIIGTMDRSRSTGLELSIQQRFKWVQLRCDQEPMRCLLHRHMLRRLANAHRGIVPMPDNSVYKAVEWIICVWQRLNEGLAKLGLLDMVFGPCFFLGCPVEANKPKPILKWLCQLWNTSISPAIADAVIKGSGADTSITGGGQTKVASTALYVLMQRAIVPGCPLSGQEKERYFANFNGTNELDIKIRGDKRDTKPLNTGTPSPQQMQSHPSYTATMRPNKSSVPFRPSYAQDGSSTGRGDALEATKNTQIASDGSRPAGVDTSNVGNSVFALSGIPTTLPSKPGSGMHISNGSLVPGVSVMSSLNHDSTHTSTSRGVHERSPLMQHAASAESGAVNCETNQIYSKTAFSYGQTAPDIVSRFAARSLNYSVQENLSAAVTDSVQSTTNGSPSLVRHSPVVVTQPGRTASPGPITMLQMADRSRSMTPPSSVNIDRGSTDRFDTPISHRSLTGIGMRGGPEMPFSMSRQSDPMQMGDFSPVHQGRNDVRPSSAGTGVGMGQFAGAENGSRLSNLKVMTSSRLPPLSDVVFSNSPIK